VRGLASWVDVDDESRVCVVVCGPQAKLVSPAVVEVCVFAASASGETCPCACTTTHVYIHNPADAPLYFMRPLGPSCVLQLPDVAAT
jgi:hypothetical protein